MSGGLIVNGIVDYYELLGVHDDVYSDEVKKAWRNVSKELHPDMQGQDTQALTAVVNHACDTLMDPA